MAKRYSTHDGGRSYGYNQSDRYVSPNRPELSNDIKSTFVVNVLHHDGTALTSRVQALSVYGALMVALHGGAYATAEVCDMHGRQLAVYDAPIRASIPG